MKLRILGVMIAACTLAACGGKGEDKAAAAAAGGRRRSRRGNHRADAVADAALHVVRCVDQHRVHDRRTAVMRDSMRADRVEHGRRLDAPRRLTAVDVCRGRRIAVNTLFRETRSHFRSDARK